MRIYTPSPDSIERISFLDTFDTCRGSEPNWHVITAGQNHDLDIPDPSFFRLTHMEETNEKPKLTTWDLRYEDDDGFPQWRPVFATPVAVWCTDDEGRLRTDKDGQGYFLQFVQVRMLAVPEYTKQNLDRVFLSFGAAEHDVQFRSYRRPSSMVDISPCRDNVYNKLMSVVETKDRARLVSRIIGEEMALYHQMTEADIADIVAPIIPEPILRSRLEASRFERAVIDRKWEERRRKSLEETTDLSAVFDALSDD
jgi:hypothetical protein